MKLCAERPDLRARAVTRALSLGGSLTEVVSVDMVRLPLAVLLKYHLWCWLSRCPDHPLSKLRGAHKDVCEQLSEGVTIRHGWRHLLGFRAVVGSAARQS